MKYTRSTFIVLFALSGVTSCTLEEPYIACGNEDNPNLGFLLERDEPYKYFSDFKQDTGDSIQLSTEDFEQIENNRCPDKWACVKYQYDSHEGMVCSQCPEEGQKSCSNRCVDVKTDENNCGECGRKCNGECLNGHCFGENDKCGDNQIDCSAKDGWKDGFCIDSTCTATECRDGYEIKNKECVKKCDDDSHEYNNSCENDDIENCGSHGYRCAEKVNDWKSGTCIKGICTPESCNHGHVYLTACENDDIYHCGEHNNACQIEGAISKCTDKKCVLDKCKDNYYLYDGKCVGSASGEHAYGGEYIDPWGLVWDARSRETLSWNQDSFLCKSLGGRLPTATEILRNEPNISELIDDTNSFDIWSSTSTYQNSGKTYIATISYDLKSKTLKISNTLTTDSKPYRCVWDPEPMPPHFAGRKCHGKPGEDQCITIKVGDIEYTVDNVDRPGQNLKTAMMECRQLGARLPDPLEYAILIRNGLPNGSDTLTWTGFGIYHKYIYYSSSSSSTNYYLRSILAKWKDVADPATDWKNILTSTNNSAGNETYKGFRCLSESVRLVDGTPVFPQPDAQTAFIVNDMLRIDATPNEAASALEAMNNCLKKRWTPGKTGRTCNGHSCRTFFRRFKDKILDFNISII